MIGDHFSLDPFAIQGIASDLKAASDDLQRQAGALGRLESEIAAAGPLAMRALGTVSGARSQVQQAGRDLDNVHGDVVQRLGLLVQAEDPFGGAFDMSLALDILNPPPPPPPEHHHGGGGLFGSILGGIESLGGDAASGLGDAASGLGDAASWAWGGVSSGASWAWGGISSGASSAWNWATSNPVDALHTGLDVLGMVPVVGDFANGANALIYLGQGDYTDAAISGAALVPVAGDAALAMRLGAKGVKAARALGEAEQLTSDAARLGRDAQDVTAAERGAAQLGSSVDTTVPGPYAGRSIPARGPERDWTPQEIQQIDDIGYTTGCHTCGTTDPGTKSGHFIPDHQRPSALNPPGEPQRLYPHCLSCSRRQGGQVRVRLPR